MFGQKSKKKLGGDDEVDAPVIYVDFKKRREAAGISQENMAGIIGVSRRTYQRLEVLGDGGFSFPQAVEMLRALGVSVLLLPAGDSALGLLKMYELKKQG